MASRPLYPNPSRRGGVRIRVVVARRYKRTRASRRRVSHSEMARGVAERRVTPSGRMLRMSLRADKGVDRPLPRRRPGGLAIAEKDEEIREGAVPRCRSRDGADSIMGGRLSRKRAGGRRRRNVTPQCGDIAIRLQDSALPNVRPRWLQMRGFRRCKYSGRTEETQLHDLER